MPQLCVRLREEDKKKLEEMSDKLGKNTTEIIRELIQTGYDRQYLTDTLNEIKTVIATMADRETVADIAEIKRVVMLIGKAMPAVSKHIS